MVAAVGLWLHGAMTSQPIDPRAVMGANNNADLYEGMFLAQRRAYRRHTYAFEALDEPPPYYSRFTLTAPGQVEAQTQMIEAHARTSGAGFSVKDGFCELDIAALALEPFIEASWLWADATQIASTPADGWRRVTTADELLRWELAWKRAGSATDARMFPAAFLDDPRVAFFGRFDVDAITGGCIANRSSDCVGLSNVFGAYRSSGLFGAAAAVARDFGAGAPVVGYDSGEGLEMMRGCGFVAVGALRVCRRTTR